jgi:hypothetical protein
VFDWTEGDNYYMGGFGDYFGTYFGLEDAPPVEYFGEYFGTYVGEYI